MLIEYLYLRSSRFSLPDIVMDEFGVLLDKLPLIERALSNKEGTYPDGRPLWSEARLRHLCNMHDRSQNDLIQALVKSYAKLLKGD